MRLDPQEMKARAAEGEARRLAYGITPEAAQAALAAARRREEAMSPVGRWLEWQGRTLGATLRQWRNKL